MTRRCGAQATTAAVFAALFALAPLARAADPAAVDGVTVAGPAVVPREFRGDFARAPGALAPLGPAARPYRPLRMPPLPVKVAPTDAFPDAQLAVALPLATMPAPNRSFAGISPTAGY